MNFAMLTALNRAPEIKLHVKGALNNGVTVEEIKAALQRSAGQRGRAAETRNSSQVNSAGTRKLQREYLAKPPDRVQHLLLR